VKEKINMERQQKRKGLYSLEALLVNTRQVIITGVERTLKDTVIMNMHCQELSTEIYK
jgi:hypothetical protein